MKTIMQVILLALIIITILFTSKVNASSGIEFSINNKEGVKAGDTFSLIIRIDNVPEQNKKKEGIKLDVLYENNLLEFVSASKKDAVSGAIDLSQNYPEEGRIRIGVVSMLSMDKSGELYEVTFKAKNDLIKSESEVRIEIKELIDADNNEIPYTVKNGTIKFEGAQLQNDSQKSSNEQAVENVQNNEEVKEQESETVTIENGKSKNIKDIIKEKYPEIDTQSNLTWKVENPEILDIDDQGNITPKKEGITNIEVTDENGNTKTIPITIGSITSNSDETQEEAVKEAKTDNNKDVGIIVVGVIIAIVIVLASLIIVKKKRK